MMRRILYPLALFAVAMLAACGNHSASTDTADTIVNQPVTLQNGVAILHGNDTFQVAAIQDVANEMALDLFIGSFDDTLLRQLLPTGSTPSAINAFMALTPSHTILFDAGLGSQAGGTLLQKLELIGRTPADVDAVCLTHLHGDHIGGLLKDGQAAFPNATLYVSATESAACVEGGALARMADLWAGVQKAYSGRVVTFADSTQLFGGLVKSIPAPGHTPGHTVYLVGNCLVAGDIIHAQDFQLEHPDFCARYDQDPKAAVPMRKHILDLVAQNGYLLCDAHCYDPFIKL